MARLEKALQQSEAWLHFSSDLFRDALNTSLRMSAQGSGVGSGTVPRLTARDPAAAQADPERAEWIFPAAEELPGGEQSWGDVLDALRRQGAPPSGAPPGAAAAQPLPGAGLPGGSDEPRRGDRHP